MAGRALGWYWTRKTATAAWRPAAYHGLSPTGRQTWESGRFVLDESAFAEIGPRILPPDVLAAIGSGAGDDIQTARLPFDVQIGSTGFRKGVHLSTLISAAQRWYDLAQPPINEEAAAELRSMMGLPEGSGTQRNTVIEELAQHFDRIGGCGQDIAVQIRALASPEKKVKGRTFECMMDGNCRKTLLACEAAGRCLAAYPEKVTANERRNDTVAGRVDIAADSRSRSGEPIRTSSVTPPAASDLRERASRFVREWVCDGLDEEMEPSCNALAAEFAAILAEARAEGADLQWRADIKAMQRGTITNSCGHNTSAGDWLAANRPSPIGDDDGGGK